MVDVPFRSAQTVRNKNVTANSIKDQAEQILQRPNALTPMGLINPQVVSREEARIISQANILKPTMTKIPHQPQALAQTLGNLGSGSAAMVFGGLGRGIQLFARPFQAAGALGSLAPEVNVPWRHDDVLTSDETKAQIRSLNRELLRGDLSLKNYMGKLIDVQEALPFGEQLRSEGPFAILPVEKVSKVVKPVFRGMSKAAEAFKSRVAGVSTDINKPLTPDKIIRDNINEIRSALGDDAVADIVQLPPSLRRATPTYNMGSLHYDPVFDNDIDKALYIVAGYGRRITGRGQKVLSAQDKKYMAWLQKQFPGSSTDELRDAGAQVRDLIRETVEGAAEGAQNIPRSPYADAVLKGRKPKLRQEIIEDIQGDARQAAGEAGETATVNAVEQLKAMVKPEGVSQRMYDQLVEYAPTLTDAQLDEQIKGSAKMIRDLKKSKTPSEVAPEFNAIAIHNLAIRISKAEKARRASVSTAGEVAGEIRLAGTYDAFKVNDAPRTSYVTPMGDDAWRYSDEAYKPSAGYMVKSDDTNRGLRWVFRLSDGRQVSLQGYLKTTHPELSGKVTSGTKALDKIWVKLSNEEKVVLVDSIPFEDAVPLTRTYTETGRDSAYVVLGQWLRANKHPLADVPSAETHLAYRLEDHLRGRTPTARQVVPGSVSQARATANAADAVISDADKVSFEDAYRVGANPEETAVANEAVKQVLKKQGRDLKYLPEDIQDMVAEHYIRFPEAMEETRRGVRTWSTTEEAARDLVNDLGGDFERSVLHRKPGEALNAEEFLAIESLVTTKTRAVKDLSELLKVPETSTTLNRVLLHQAKLEQSAIIDGLIGGSAEAGRTLNIHKKWLHDALQSSDPEIRLLALLRKFGTKPDDMDKLAELIRAATARGVDITSPGFINSVIREFDQPTLMDYAYEIFINSILSGMKTHIINFGSNGSQVAQSLIEKTAAVPLEQIVAKWQGRPPARYWNDSTMFIRGAYQGFKEGYKAGWEVLRNGLDPVKASKVEYRKRAFTGRLGEVIRLPGTLLEAADQLWYAINYRGELHVAINRSIKRKGLTGDIAKAEFERLIDPTNTPRKMLQSVHEAAEYRLFRGEIAPSLQRLMRMKNEGGVMGNILRFFIPFIRTPTNILTYGLARSPLGLANPKMWRAFAAKDPVFADYMGGAILGTIGTAGVLTMFGEGRITARAPSNRAARDQFYREGKLPYAIKIGDTWIQYQRLEPLNQFLGQAAILYEAFLDEESEGSITEKAMRAASNLANNLTSQTYMSNIGDLISIMESPERDADRILGRIAGGMVPYSGFLRTIAQAIDPKYRRPQGIVEPILANIPGLSRTTTPVLTALGEEAQRTEPGEGFVSRFARSISPIAWREEDDSKLTQELNRLNINVSFTGTTIGGVRLTKETERKYQRDAGQLIKNRLANAVNSPYWDILSDTDRESVMRRIMNDAKEEVRTAIMMNWYMPATR